MTVYNITKLNPKLAQAVAYYLDVPKVEIRYSDFSNTFGVYIKPRQAKYTVNPERYKIACKFVTKKLGQCYIKDLIQYPEVYKNSLTSRGYSNGNV